MEQLSAERYIGTEKYLSVGSATADEIKIISTIEQTKVDLLTLENTLNNISNTLEYLTGKEVSVEKGSTVVLQK